jgi:hypothetical protein
MDLMTEDEKMMFGYLSNLWRDNIWEDQLKEIDSDTES